MLGGTASARFSAGRTVDNKGTSPLEKALGPAGLSVQQLVLLSLLLRCLSGLVYIFGYFLRLIYREQFIRSERCQNV